MQLKSVFAWCLLCALSIQVYTYELEYQHWAGPIEERIAEVKPGDVKYHSSYTAKHAKVSQTGELNFKLEKGVQPRFVIFSSHTYKESFDVAVKHTAEVGAEFVDVSEKVESGELISSETAEDLTSFGVTAVGHGFAYNAPVEKDGNLKIRFEKKAGAVAHDDVMVVVSSNSPIKLQVTTDSEHPLVDVPLTISASFFDSTIGATAVVGTITSAKLTVSSAAGSEKYVMTVRGDDDDNDEAGWASTSFTPSVAGQYRIAVQVNGLTNDQQKIERSYDMLIQVAERSASLTGIANIDDDGSNLKISVGVDTSANSSRYILYGELYGSNENGDVLPVCYVTGMSDVKEGALELSVHAGWLKRTEAHAPYYLKNVRLVDTATYIVLSRSSTMRAQHGSGAVVSSPRVAKHIKITDELRMGRQQKPLVTGANGLIVSHGYCSSSNPFPTANFPGAYFFLDANKANSHDQFARNIHNYAVGRGLTGYGIVAHSQGGAASLHLYTWYSNSGLRNTRTGSRLIQSVGTPYQGTALAGILAAIGSWFGISCGSVTDLTYSGAARWLGTIPAASRRQVFFYTTSFARSSWLWNYCSIVTDLLLRDPDDGVTEQWSGTLSGANNMGHTLGWCHTTRMRDPPQTNDGARNAIMNNLARR